MLVIGGMGSVSGSIIGAAAITVVAEGLRRIEDTTLLYGMSQIILAVIFLFIITFRREGLLGQREVSLDRLFAPGWRQRLPWTREAPAADAQSPDPPPDQSR
jgi:branched-chain amino acid transport system permease protein